MGSDVLGDVYIRYSGIHRWSVSFKRHPEYQASHGRDFVVHLELGPSAWQAINRGRWQAAAISEPDYTRIFVLDEQSDNAIQSEVSVSEVIEGLATGDYRLRDEIIELFRLTEPRLDQDPPSSLPPPID